MKKWLFFAGGFFIGVVMTLLCFTFLNKDDNNSPETKVETEADNNASEQQREELKKRGITLFDEVGDVVKEKSVKVLQVIADDAALVKGQDEDGDYFGIVYLIVNSEGGYYYDDQIIEVSDKQEFRQVGIYRYETKNGYKTVPIIGKVDKDFGGAK